MTFYFILFFLVVFKSCVSYLYQYCYVRLDADSDRLLLQLADFENACHAEKPYNIVTARYSNIVHSAPELLRDYFLTKVHLPHTHKMSPTACSPEQVPHTQSNCSKKAVLEKPLLVYSGMTPL